MGANLQLLAFFFLIALRGSLASDLPPMGLIPTELLAFFHPEDVEDLEHPGVVGRQRRASGVDDSTTPGDDRPIYTLYTQDGAPCILVKTDAIFHLNYRTLRPGVKSVKIVLPDAPTLTGMCVHTGITAILNFHWSVFKFSLVFDQNPEGNSYYLNKAVLEFNQTSEYFPDTTYRGHVILNTKEGGNFYFTPLGKSYVCEDGEDQGPLKLYNQDDEMSGNLTMFNTRFQPFVKRAKGDWGPGEHCLPKATQVMRENVVPYVSSLVFSFSVVIMVAVYGIIRYFTTKKTAYTFYGDGTEMNADDGETHEMKYVQNGAAAAATATAASVHKPDDFDYDFSANGTNGSATAAQQLPQQAPAAANPFRREAAATNNPFNQSNV